MRAAFPRIAFLACLVAIGTGCGQMATTPASTPPPSPSPSCVPSTHPEFAYVLNSADATISMYTADSCTGALTGSNPATVPTGVDNGFNAESMAIDPTGRFLYVANLGSNATDAATVSMFTIDPNTGMLTATTPGQVPTGFYPQGIAASANFVYTANSDDNSVSMFTTNTSNGLLTPLSPSETFVPPLFSSRSSFSSPGFVTVGPSGQFLYVSDAGNGSISTFSINSKTGALTPTNPAGVIAGPYPWQVSFDPEGKFSYVPDEDIGDVYMYTVDAITGTLTPNPAVLVPAGNQPAYMAVHPSGKFAYVVNRYDGTVSMYNIDPSTGTLSANAPSTVQAGGWPYPIAVNAAGTFVYVGNQDDSSLSIYSVGPTGVLTPAGTVQTGNDPVAIVLRN
ncbi:MAG: beta-propeller fold lactonase family protein [Candidatus Sulfotelmatobacter sp.]